MGRYRRSRTHKGRKAFSRSCRTRNRARDLDQVHADLLQASSSSLSLDVKAEGPESELDEVAGGGRHPCVHCARHFIDQTALDKHVASKLHKKRLRLLKERPYSQAEAESAAGMGSYDLIESR